MNIKEYFEKAKMTRSRLNSRLDDELHMVLGMVTEAGELADMYKKHIAYSRELDIANAIEEVGDMMWYIANYLDIIGVDIEDVLEVNIAKLMSRYPDGKFDSKRANERDTSKEREIIENLITP